MLSARWYARSDRTAYPNGHKAIIYGKVKTKRRIQPLFYERFSWLSRQKKKKRVTKILADRYWTIDVKIR